MSVIKRNCQIVVLLMGLAVSGFFAFMGVFQMAFATRLEQTRMELQPASVTPSCAADPDCANHAHWAETWQQFVVEGQRAQEWEARIEAKGEFTVAFVIAVLSVLGFATARMNDGTGKAAADRRSGQAEVTG